MKAILVSAICVLLVSSSGWSDTFGTGTNQFNIDFLNISGATNPTSGVRLGGGFTFTGVANDYRIGKFEITNDQWNKFKAAYGTVTGNPSEAYAYDSYWTGARIPVNCISMYEAAQFVNWLNTSTGHQAAYKFTGTIGTSGYTFQAWQAGDTGYNASNPYRNSNAFYFLPTENEWVKAAYWNGTELQTYATMAGQNLYQGNGSNGGWNYLDSYSGGQPWNVGSGSQELNGTYDMMGNLGEWTESLTDTSFRNVRGGGYFDGTDYLNSYTRMGIPPYNGGGIIGFRVAATPEPATLLLLGLGAVVLRKRKR